MSEERDWGRAYIYMEYMHWAHPVCPYIPTLHPSPHCPHPQMLWGPLSLWLSIGFDNWRCQQEPREWEGTPVRVFMSWSPPCWWSASFHLRWHLPPSGSLPTATWFSGYLLPPPSPFRPSVTVAPYSFQPWTLHYGHISFPEFHHLLVKRFFTKPSSGSVCHLFPLRTSMDAINKKTRLLMNHLCRQNYGPLFRSS